MICTRIERIRPGAWFWDNSNTKIGRKMMKIQDILPSGLFSGLARIYFDTNKQTIFSSDFIVNAIDNKGCPCCCPPKMVKFWVKSYKDLYPENIEGCTLRHYNVELAQ